MAIYYRRTNIFKYRLEHDYDIKLPDRFHHVGVVTPYIELFGTNLRIKKGYRWDGPSGPTIDTPSFMRGSLVHDVLYQLIREGYLSKDLRKYADRLLLKHCREDGMGKIYSWIVFRAVRWFGASAIDPEGHIEIRTAP